MIFDSVPADFKTLPSAHMISYFKALMLLSEIDAPESKAFVTAKLLVRTAQQEHLGLDQVHRLVDRIWATSVQNNPELLDKSTDHAEAALE